LKKKKTSIKGKRNQKNEGKIKKKNINVDWKTKLKTNKTLTKESMIKMRNQKNKDQIKKKIYEKL
jgi:hypothetical protein